VGTNARCARGKLPLVFFGDLRVEVRLPGLQTVFPIRFDKPLDFVQLTSIETIVRRQFDRIKPELRFLLRRLDVNMGRLRALVAEKVESKSADSQHCRHQ